MDPGTAEIDVEVAAEEWVIVPLLDPHPQGSRGATQPVRDMDRISASEAIGAGTCQLRNVASFTLGSRTKGSEEYAAILVEIGLAYAAVTIGRADENLRSNTTRDVSS